MFQAATFEQLSQIRHPTKEARMCNKLWAVLPYVATGRGLLAFAIDSVLNGGVSLLAGWFLFSGGVLC